MKKKLHIKVESGGKAAWGILFLLGAAAFLASKMGLFEGIGFWPIVFTIFLTATLIKGLLRLSWGSILFSLACLVIVHDEFLELEAITPWPVLGAALLGTIGLNLIFPRSYRARICRSASDRTRRNGMSFSCENAFGSSVKYITGEIEMVNLENAFGTLEVYFTDAVLKGHEARVYVDSAFGKTCLYIPGGWKVVNEVEAEFAGSYCGSAGGEAGEDTLYLAGNVAFGQLSVQYI